jgi:hypothetical protein
MPTYYTHANYNRPFKVVVDKSNVSVYKDTNEDFDKEPVNSKLVRTFTVKKVYVGKSTGGTIGDHTVAQAKEFVGNSILLELASPANTYVFVGHEIYEFKMPDDNVQKYFSLVGNNDVPYPVLLGKNNVYFMLDKKFVSREHFPLKMTPLQWEDAYNIFIGDWDTKKGIWVNSLEDMAKKMKGVKVIQKRSL